MYFDFGSFARQTGRKIVSTGKAIGHSAVEGAKNAQKTYEESYAEACEMRDHDLYYAYVNAFNPTKKLAYQRVAIERGMMEKNEQGIFEWKRYG